MDVIEITDNYNANSIAYSPNIFDSNEEALSFNKEENVITFSDNYLIGENKEILEPNFYSIFKDTSSQTSILGQRLEGEGIINENSEITNEKEDLRVENFEFHWENNINKKIAERNSDNNCNSKKISIEIKEEKQEKEKEKGKNIIFKNEKYEQKTLGRKRNKDKKNGKNGMHTKNNDDNIIRKIKVFVSKSIYNYIKKMQKDLLKLDPELNENLKRDYNLELFQKTLKDIYKEENISAKYTKRKNTKTNEELINKIFKENKNLEAIKILNLTYLEVFKIFRRNLTSNKEISDELKEKIKGTNILNTKYFEDAEIFFETLRERGNKEEDFDLESYIEDVKRLILQFENWFSTKIGRER